ncbi:MAG TPA: hypothetical protein VFY58_02915 [Nocardioides sp.]|nr:hypothetical protein [Nocardioides sp.]
MSTITTTTASDATATGSERSARIICGLAAAAAVVPFTLAGLSGDSGAEITAGLLEETVPLTIASIVAVLASAGMFLAAARLSDAIGGTAGRVAAGAGAGIALMFALYYSTFGAAAVVASQMLQEPGAGLGEAASLLLNLTEIARYAPGLALVAAAFVARRRLPRLVGISAGVLAFLTIVPLTSWVAALLIPLWLGASAAVVRVPR